MTLRFVSLWVCLWSLCVAVAAAAPYEPRVGAPHADFVLPRIDSGEPVALSQFRGRKVILIHFASW